MVFTSYAKPVELCAEKSYMTNKTHLVVEVVAAGRSGAIGGSGRMSRYLAGSLWDHGPRGC